jgi:hypothetical protein
MIETPLTEDCKPITLEIVLHGRVVTNAVRAPMRPATRWMFVVLRASGTGISSRIVVRGRASIDWPANGGPIMWMMILMMLGGFRLAPSRLR